MVEPIARSFKDDSPAASETFEKQRNEISPLNEI
jgi:hypothetical protein